MISHFFSLVKRKLCVKLSLKYYTTRIRNASNICQQLVHNKRRRRFKVRKIAQKTWIQSLPKGPCQNSLHDVHVEGEFPRRRG